MLRRREERELEEQKRELAELDRDTRTVFAYNLSTKADEREIYGFFSQAGASLSRVTLVPGGAALQHLRFEVSRGGGLSGFRGGYTQL